MFKKFLSAILSLSLVFSLAVPALASEVNTFSEPVITETETGRIAEYNGVIAVYDQSNNTVTVTEDGETYTLELNNYYINENSNPMALASDTLVRSGTVWMHEYEYKRDSNRNYYWIIDIPSLSINVTEWCDPLTVYERDDKKAVAACEKFAEYIDEGEDHETKLLAFGGAVLVSAAVAYLTKNIEFTQKSFIATCAALGIAITSDIAGTAGDYINCILNSRDEYYAVAAIL